jgi:hypothetical protein
VKVGDLVKCTLEEAPTYGIVVRTGKWNLAVMIDNYLRWVSVEYLEKLNDAND